MEEFLRKYSATHLLIIIIIVNNVVIMYGFLSHDGDMKSMDIPKEIIEKEKD